ncbi:MAG: hypothetical protein WB116_02070 [Candidatus Dormiibacterota bacterium]
MADVAGGLESGAGDAVEHVKGAASDVWGKFKKLPTWAKIALAIVVVLIVLLIAGVFGGSTSAASTPSTTPTPTPDPGTGGSGGSGGGSAPSGGGGNPGGGSGAPTPAPSGSGVGGGGGAAPVPESIPTSLAGGAPTSAPVAAVHNAAAKQTAKTVANIMKHPTNAGIVPVTAAQKAKNPGIQSNAPQIRAPSGQLGSAAGSTSTRVVPSGSRAPAKKVTVIKKAPPPKPVKRYVPPKGTAGVRRA